MRRYRSSLKANGLKHVKHATSKRIICCKKVLHTSIYTHTHIHSSTDAKWQSHTQTGPEGDRVQQGKPNKLLCNCKPLCCSFAQPTHRKLIQTPGTKGRKNSLWVWVCVGVGVICKRRMQHKTKKKKKGKNRKDFASRKCIQRVTFSLRGRWWGDCGGALTHAPISMQCGVTFLTRPTKTAAAAAPTMTSSKPTQLYLYFLNLTLWPSLFQDIPQEITITVPQK